MNDNINICPECGTENEAQYPYCKNCGSHLAGEVKTEQTEQPPVAEAVPESNNTPAPNFNTGNSNGYYSATGTDYACIDGIPVEEIKMFIGKKSNEIMPKFINMEITRSKNSWLWPPAVLGFFFGPLGAAIWFFYRKMYKHAFILTVIGAVINLVNALLTFNTTDTYMDSFFSAFANGDLNEIISSIENSVSLLDTIASLISDIANVATSVITGIFGCFWYKEHCISKIKSFRAMNPDNNYYKLGLMSLGGTSGGMLALGILLNVGVESVVSFITTILTTII